MKKYIPLALSLFIAFVFVQSLYFKFGNSLETQHIFGTLGEWSGILWFGSYGGYIIGVAELIASILLFTRLRPIGALMALGIMSGAIIFHLFTPLGIVMPIFDASTGALIDNDGGTLFIMACGTWLCALLLLLLETKNSESLLYKYLPR